MKKREAKNSSLRVLSLLPDFYNRVIDFYFEKHKVHGLNSFNNRKNVTEIERPRGRFYELLTTNLTNVSCVAASTSGSIKTVKQKTTGRQEGK